MQGPPASGALPSRAVFEQAAVGLAQLDARGGFLHVNQAFCDMVGHFPDHLTARDFNWRQLFAPGDLDADQATLDLLTRGEIEAVDLSKRLLRKDGQGVWVDLSLRLLADGAAGGPRSFVLTAVDTTEHRQNEETIRRHAFYDGLTQLPNRRLLLDRLQQTVALARRAGTCVGLLFIDLDNFKPVNDELGHRVGDWLLQSVAKSLTGCLRAYDTASRFGGDEFVVLLPDLAQREAALVVAERIRVALEQPFVTKTGRQLKISSSIGVVLFPDHANSERGLLQEGDSAMYQAKKSGRNKIVCPERGRLADSEGESGAHSSGRLVQLSWEGKYACGDASIDGEHRELFRQGNQLLETAVRADLDPAAFKATLKRLLGLIAVHIHHEEEVLKQRGYPRLAEHAAKHLALWERAKVLRAQSEERGITVGELIDFLVVDVISKHILQEDRDYFPWLESPSEPSHEEAVPVAVAGA